MKRILLFSGGLDSFILWQLLDYPDCIYYALGHRYQQAEVDAIRNLQAVCKQFKLPDLKVSIQSRLSLGDIEQPSGYIPMRNGLFAMLSAGVGADVVYIGALRGESNRDKSAYFLNHISELLTYMAGRKIHITAPFRHLTKAGLVAAYINQYPERIALMKHTSSCYNASSIASDQQGCGMCIACFRRWVAMKLNGVEENYSHPPYQWSGIRRSNWRDWLNQLLRSDIREWLSILVNNYEAYKALRSV